MPTDSETPNAEAPAKANRRRRLAWIGVAAVVTVAGGWWVAVQCAEVGNYAIHTSLANEARQISSAANRYFTEKKTENMPMRELGKLLASGPGPKRVSADGVHFQGGSYKDMTGSLKRDGFFYVGHPEFSKERLTRHPECKASGGPDFAMKFSVETGAPAP